MHSIPQHVALAVYQAGQKGPRPPAQSPQGQDLTMEERIEGLRRKCNSAAYRLHKVIDVPIQEIHGKFRPQKGMSEGDLRDKYRILVGELRKADQ